VFPWTANLYLDGEYLCGATLVHQEWVLIGYGCANKISAKDPTRNWVVARMGGYRDAQLSSGTEEFNRIIYITNLPASNIYLGRFERPVQLSEYINIICIPNVKWIPDNAVCTITGKHGDILNHAFEIEMHGRCPPEKGVYTSTHFDLCAKERAHTGECLREWSGALACPDHTGKYHAIGVYYTENGGCDGNSPPQRFTPLVTRAVRTGINTIIKAYEYVPKDLIDFECNPKDGKHRCPLGNCLEQEKMCNGFPDCLDASDENLELCKSRGPIMCNHVNATHCVCPSGHMLCQNQVCVSKLDFCNQVDDCGDGTDEPEGCDQCDVGIETIGDATKLCDNKIDCREYKDLASDESAKRCCGDDPELDFRCVLGEPQVSYDDDPDDSSLGFSNTCINSTGVCDGDVFGRESCPNGADEANCIAIWPDKALEKDAFGRIKSQSEGFMLVIINGRPFVYCANPVQFTKEIMDRVGEVLCKAEGFEGIESTSATVVPTEGKQTLKNVDFSPKVQKQFDDCFLLYIKCQTPPYLTKHDA